MENLTTLQLKDIIRQYKKKNCPPFSRLKKKELMELVNELGLDITLIPKKKPKTKEEPKPEPKEKPKEKPKIKDIVDSLTPEQIEKYKATGNESWVANQSNQLILYEYILDKHSNDCIPIVKNIDGEDAILMIKAKNTELKKPKMLLAWGGDKRNTEPASPEDLKKTIKKIRECKKRFIPLPFSFGAYKTSNKDNFAHLNMIILDLQNNTAEHLEPHGDKFYMGNEKAVQGLKYLINEKLPELFKEWGFTYINPAESCPYKQGVQSIDAYGKNTPFQKISRKVEIEAFNQFSKEQGGLCALWSYILLDLRLSNPDYTIQEIMKQVLKDKSIEEFKTDVLEDYEKSIDPFFQKNLKGSFSEEKYIKYLFNEWKGKQNFKLSDIFFMYAITFAHEAFGKNTTLLVKLIKERAEKYKMDNFMDFLKSSKINPFKLMWVLDKIKNQVINLEYINEDEEKKKVDNPKDIKTYTFYYYVEKELSKILLKRLLNKSSLIQVKSNGMDYEPL